MVTRKTLLSLIINYFDQAITPKTAASYLYGLSAKVTQMSHCRGPLCIAFIHMRVSFQEYACIQEKQ